MDKKFAHVVWNQTIPVFKLDLIFSLQISVIVMPRTQSTEKMWATSQTW